jgi:hypothetical protein
MLKPTWLVMTMSRASSIKPRLNATIAETLQSGTAMGFCRCTAYLEGKEEEEPNDTEGHMGKKALRPSKLESITRQQSWILDQDISGNAMQIKNIQLIWVGDIFHGHKELKALYLDKSHVKPRDTCAH